MTFKHLKFAESSTMQAFEKLAKDRGMVVPDVVKKTAKPSLDLNPSKNFLENILKLTAGLRAQGFVRHAEDLEKKYVVYKRAESLYETSKETGEDVVDQAHPKGSHTLDGGHKVLTIVDQKKEIEQVVNKKPTGKFASNNEIINAVKLVFAAETSLQFVSEFLVPHLNAALTELQKNKDNRSVNALTSIKSLIDSVSRLTEATLASEINRVGEAASKIREELVLYSNEVKGDFFGDDHLNAERALIDIGSAVSDCDKIKRALKIESASTERHSKVPKFLAEVAKELKNVDTMTKLVNTLTDENDKNVGLQWTAHFNKSLSELQNNPNLKTPEIADRIVDKLTPGFLQLKQQISDFDSKL